MGALYRFKCPNCGYEIEAWDDGHPYILDDAGKRHFYYHPCERDVLDRIIEQSKWAAGKTSEEIERELDSHTGCLVEAICLDCGAKRKIEDTKQNAQCRKCKGNRVVQVLALGGKTCPECKRGTISEEPAFGAIS